MTQSASARRWLGRAALLGSLEVATVLGCTAPRADAGAEGRPVSGTRPPAVDVVGYWAGTAVFRGASLQMAVRFERQRGRLTATLSAPDILLLDQPLTDVVADTLAGAPGNALLVFFTLDDPDGSLAFAGSRVADTIAGTALLPAVAAAREGAARMTWRLVHVVPPASPPYGARELRIAGRNVVLAATLLIPRDRRASHPGILILQGSSTNLRAQYRFYADHFARAGFVVLSFDKRGNGASSGDYRRASYDDLVADARAAFDSLAAQPNVDRRHVGLWGLSQGAFIAPLVAEDSADRTDRRVAFVVAVSAPGVPIAEAAAYQDSLHVAWAGLSPAAAREAAAAHRDLASALRAGASSDRVAAVFRRVADKPWRPLTGMPRTPPSTDELRGWYWYGRTLDPVTWWRRLRAPVLLVYGEADELVPARASAERLERALHEGKNPDAKVRIYPGANHVVRLVSSPLAPRDARWDWPRPARGYLADVSAWLDARVGTRPSTP